MAMARINEDRVRARFGKDPAAIVRKDEPFNAGPPAEVLRQSYVTPAHLFFVRNHGTVQAIDPKEYKLRVDGVVRRPLRLTLQDIRQDFPKVTLAATIQCAGNRRKELMKIAPIEGQVPWDTEAVSNGIWGGIRLRHVLLAAGAEREATDIAFEGLDDVQAVGRTTEFGGSIPKEKAMGPEVILAYELNGRPLSPLHGYPLRVVVPGYIGARSVKWLGKVTARSSPSENYFQQHAYKLLPPWDLGKKAEVYGGRTLQEQRVNSVICRPGDGSRLADDVIAVEGYAITGGGREIERVEVSINGGQSWMPATLADSRSPWTWCFWEAHLRLRPGRHQIAVRAWDSAGETQPMRASDVWNPKGYMNNAWHSIDVSIDEAG